MMRFLFAALAVFLFAAPVSTPAVAQSNTDLGTIIFKELEKQLIQEYFGNRTKSYQSYDSGSKGKGKKGKKGQKNKNKQMPPGLAKKNKLPPGLAMQLQRNGTLPPGLAKRDLPYDLARRLPPPPRGSRRYVVDNDIVLIEQATGLILDILKDVLK